MPPMSDLKERRAWCQNYIKRAKEGVIRLAEAGVIWTCPCCGYPTLEERGGFEICAICHWEDDGQDDPDAGEVLGGPNADYSLAEARENFRKHRTMYRPSDRIAFQRDTSLSAMKKKHKLIVRFEEMRKGEA